MAKFKVEWWETRVYRCSTIIEADTEDQAELIAMEPFCEGSREWTKEELNDYDEYLKETDDNGLIKIERI